MIDARLRSNKAITNLCGWDGGWTGKKLYYRQNIERADGKEESICFDITAAWPETQTAIRTSSSLREQLLVPNSYPPIEDDLEKAGVPIRFATIALAMIQVPSSDCESGRVVGKPPPREAMQMKKAWLESQFPQNKIVSEELVGESGSYFGRFAVEKPGGERSTVCVDVTSQLTPCGNSLPGRQPDKQSLSTRDSTVVADGYVDFKEGLVAYGPNGELFKVKVPSTP